MNTYEYARMNNEEQEYIENEIKKSRAFSNRMAKLNTKITAFFSIGVFAFIGFWLYQTHRKKKLDQSNQPAPLNSNNDNGNNPTPHINQATPFYMLNRQQGYYR